MAERVLIFGCTDVRLDGCIVTKARDTHLCAPEEALTPADKAALVAFLEEYGLPYFGSDYRDTLIAKLTRS